MALYLLKCAMNAITNLAMSIEWIRNVFGVGIGQEAHPLGTSHVETDATHSSVAANRDACSGHHGVLAEVARPLSPL